MKVGDMVKAVHVAEGLRGSKRGNVGFIVRIDRSPVSHRMRYWVKLFGGWNIESFPFMERQLEIISESR